MGEKRLYTDNMQYTEEAEQVRDEIKEKIMPIISSYIKSGYSQPEVMYLLYDTISFELRFERIDEYLRRSKQQKSQESEEKEEC